MTIKKLSEEEFKPGFSNNSIVGTNGHLPEGNTLKGPILIYKYPVLMFAEKINLVTFRQLLDYISIFFFSVDSGRTPVVTSIG